MYTTTSDRVAIIKLILDSGIMSCDVLRGLEDCGMDRLAVEHRDLESVCNLLAHDASPTNALARFLGDEFKYLQDDRDVDSAVQEADRLYDKVIRELETDHGNHYRKVRTQALYVHLLFAKWKRVFSRADRYARGEG